MNVASPEITKPSATSGTVGRSASSVTWLPSHPAMGWVSMNRCWSALEEQRRAHPAVDLAFSCPFPVMPVETPGKGRFGRVWQRSVVYPRIVRRLANTDLVHVLDHSFGDLLTHVPKGVKKVVTVHDVIPMIEPYGMSDTQQKRFRKRVESVRLADRILCVSEFTRRTLLQEVELDPLKVSVLANGVDVPKLEAAVGSDPFPKVPGVRLLLVGSTLRRKNLRILPALLREMKGRGMSTVVLRIGQMLPDELRTEIQAVIGADHFLELGLVSDETLSAAYRTADCLLFPSTLEGFGLPVLEAMGNGCPVVCSDAASLPEVCGSAGLLFPPHDAGAAAAQCIRVFSEPGLKEQMIARGRLQAEEHTWDQHWSALCDVYREVLGLS